MPTMMMKMHIWKYELLVQESQTLELPVGARVVALQVQRNDIGNLKPHLWALVNPEAKRETRSFRMLKTGENQVPAECARTLAYLGSFQLHDGQFVAHVFEEL